MRIGPERESRMDSEGEREKKRGRRREREGEREKERGRRREGEEGRGKRPQGGKGSVFTNGASPNFFNSSMMFKICIFSGAFPFKVFYNFHN